MNFINKMERRFGRYAIHNLTKYIIGIYVLGYILEYMGRLTGFSVLSWLVLSPYHIVQGQIWRLISWVLIPPPSSNLLFVLIMLMFYYSIGTALERTWGAFRYNLYIFGGIICTVIGAFLLYAIGGPMISVYGSMAFSTYYINLSIFLAFAASYPDMQVLFMMIIPMKMKWLAYLDIAYLLYDLIRGNWATRTVIIASLFNFILFFLATRNYTRISPGQMHRRQEFKKAVHPKMAQGVTKHKCAICGRTEKDGDHLEFRFCSKCNGNYEYCQDHLFTHEHVK
ncbi:MAG TPA: rhomboid family intramembrane serine protease [Candidatus Blautia merdavium]|uniref:Rhomboid family intramembrane serine protease n=1 Tax=Candidatus Blautia merdavium TaxID=2838494 RepID=A0A9D2PQG5_9FIRM|nr:rhomboid family intramembrane serine protease [Candidatus Blautia merdavium]